MLEIAVVSLAAWLLLAAASFRYRRQLDIPPVATGRLRLAAAILLTTAFVRCGTEIDGERWVRFFGAASLAGVVVVALLSIVPTGTMRPVALLRRRKGDTAAMAPERPPGSGRL